MYGYVIAQVKVRRQTYPEATMPGGDSFFYVPLQLLD